MREIFLLKWWILWRNKKNSSPAVSPILFNKFKGENAVPFLTEQERERGFCSTWIQFSF